MRALDDGIRVSEEPRRCCGPGIGRRTGPVRRATVLLVALAVVASGCGGDDPPAETGGLATTASATDAAEAPPTGPLDPLVAERIGDLELDVHAGAPKVFEVGAEDARDLGYGADRGPGAVVTLSLWPSEQRAKGYSRRFAELLVSDSGFEIRDDVRDVEGPRGPGVLLRLADEEGTEAAIWTSGRLAVVALADRPSLKTVLESAPFGLSGERDRGGSG